MPSCNIDNLYRELEEIANGDIQYYLYERIMNKEVKKEYSSWVLCCGVNSCEILRREWENIVECFAVYFQTTLLSEIERGNLYVIFFTEYIIPNRLKMEIEYDRYSSRKIIINKSYPEDTNDLINIIENLIFKIRDYENVDRDKVLSLSEWLKTNEPELKGLYEKYSYDLKNIEDAFSEYSDL